MPHGVYPCLGEEQWCALSVWNHAEWRRLAKLLGDSALAERYATVLGRKAHEAEIDLVGDAVDLGSATIRCCRRAARRRLARSPGQLHGRPVCRDALGIAENEITALEAEGALE